MSKLATGKNNKVLTIDKITILEVLIRFFPIGKESIVVTYAAGYENAKKEFIPIEHKQIGIQGEDYTAIAAAVPDISNGIFDALKQILYTEIEKAAI